MSCILLTIPCLKYGMMEKVLLLRVWNLQEVQRLSKYKVNWFPIVFPFQSCPVCRSRVEHVQHVYLPTHTSLLNLTVIWSTLNATCTLQTALIRNATIDCEEGNHSGTCPQSKAKNTASFNINILCSACPKGFGTSSESRSLIDSFYIKNDLKVCSSAVLPQRTVTLEKGGVHMQVYPVKAMQPFLLHALNPF